jgi:hypothetical protein
MSETVRQVVIVVPMAPASCLSPNGRRRGNVWEQRRATSELREAAWAAVRTDRSWTHFDHGPYSIHEHIVWPKSRKLVDPDGLTSMCKAAVDGIVDSGLLPGDSAKHIAHISASQERGDDATGRIEITIEEVVE